MRDLESDPIENRDVGVIFSRAPVRINDLGGWTDTWFSGTGNVLSTAVSPGTTCRLSFTRPRPPVRKRFTLDVKNFNDRYSFDPDDPPPGRHPLLEAAVASMDMPPGMAVEASISSGMPPGCGTGTSASVVVALIGALDRLKPGEMDAGTLWRAAHRVETEMLGLESGVQDQISAAYGGTCFIDVYRYPEAHVSRVELDRGVAADLERRLVLVFLGEGHRSSEVHREVIECLARGGGVNALAGLREIPSMAREALEEGDLARLGALMARNTECQRSLDRRLVSPEADTVIALARGLGAPGWKVNGAGGQGGSLTLLAGNGPGAREDLARGLRGLGGGIRDIPVKLDYEGLSVRVDES
ncbi:MAG: GHMP kinase [Actinobacteria bacterium]|nr:GHMP kinase [Actinomycetota bacterium]MCG2817636.1 GHMP kinase [Actinomycetes bacterium]MBU4218906.1 GHMP kinase [Actinomycetota bacterium]MBU4358506.1 GHMP kinase [Actinomycetota bacterium]MBU4393090.1 GHMP kinase [Actinomycetota bacterium]